MPPLISIFLYSSAKLNVYIQCFWGLVVALLFFIGGAATKFLFYNYSLIKKGALPSVMITLALFDLLNSRKASILLY
jgi:hypothetical protein